MSIVHTAFYIKDVTIGAGNVFRETVVRVCVSCCTVIALVWVAILMYVSFYYAYLPTVHHAQPVFLQFSSDCGNGPQNGLCSYPEANVSLSKGERILMRGQKYQVYLDLELPHSPVNEKLGMFMVTVKFLSYSGKAVATSSRASMLHFKSGFLKLISTMLMSLPLVLGFSEEKQIVAVKMFENYVEDSYHPVTSVNVAIMAKHIEIYGAFLRIEAQFSGFRYILFNWPISSAVICISANFMVVCILFFFAYNAFTPEPTENEANMAAGTADGQEHLYSDARRRDLGGCEHRVQRSPVRSPTGSPTRTPPSARLNGRSSIRSMCTRNKAPNLHNSDSSTHRGCHSIPRERLRSASFPPCRWKLLNHQPPSSSWVGETLRGPPRATRGDRSPVHPGRQVGYTQGVAVTDEDTAEANPDDQGIVQLDVEQPMNHTKTKENKYISLKFTPSDKSSPESAGSERVLYSRLNKSASLDDCSDPKFPSYTVLKPRQDKEINSPRPLTENKENQADSSESLTSRIPDGALALDTTRPAHSARLPGTSNQEEQKSSLRKRTSNKTRSKFGLSFKKMLPRR